MFCLWLFPNKLILILYLKNIAPFVVFGPPLRNPGDGSEYKPRNLRYEQKRMSVLI